MLMQKKCFSYTIPKGGLQYRRLARGTVHRLQYDINSWFMFGSNKTESCEYWYDMLSSALL